MSDSEAGGSAGYGNETGTGNLAGGGNVAAPPSGERAVPYHCPFCAEEDLRPHGPKPGAWHCRSCLRVFSVKFLGIEPIPPLVVPASKGVPSTDTLGG